ncbi:MAG TPA: hypothetical protein VGD74_03315 [Vulgatibacter sp.]
MAIVGLSSCADDCDVACGKLQFCGELPDVSLNMCVDRCHEREPENGDRTRTCADCLHGSSCNTVRRGGCAADCEPVVGPRSEMAGGSGGEEGVAGSGGAEGAVGGAGGS